MKTMKTDVLVVGSGFGAMAPALRMAQAGHRVLVIEKGPDIEPGRDFQRTQDPKYLLSYLKSVSSDTVSFTFAEGLGGGSGFFEMVSLRAPSPAFEQVDANSRRLWPGGIDRQVLNPFYDVGESMLKVHQIGRDRIPKTGVAFSHLFHNLGYTCDRARYAVAGCENLGYCVSGCPIGAKQSLHFNYLSEAKGAGAKVVCDLEALQIRPYASLDRTSRYRYLVSCRGSKGEDVGILARDVVLGGGTVGTARLLLDSRPHLTGLSDQVGKNVAVNGSIKAVALLPEGFVEGDMVSGMSHSGMISYEFFESMGITISAAKPKPLTIAASARLSYADDRSEPRYWGQQHVDIMRQYRRRMMVLYALGLTPPNAEIRSNGPGRVQPHLTLDSGLRDYHARVSRVLNQIFTRNGCRVLDVTRTGMEGKEYPDLHFDTAHMVGSCRMADHPRHGVVDPNGEVFNHPGLYVTDGAAVPTSLAVNVALTILANSERIAERMVQRSTPAGVSSRGTLVASER